MKDRNQENTTKTHDTDEGQRAIKPLTDALYPQDAVDLDDPPLHLFSSKSPRIVSDTKTQQAQVIQDAADQDKTS
ncbi:MAG: hypothetical protein ABSE77_21365 [Acidimicrobiales bacterium]